MGKIGDGFLITNGLSIHKGPINRSDYIEISYIINQYNQDQRIAIDNKFNLSIKELEFIFGQGLFNCLTNNIDSTFEIQKIIEIDQSNIGLLKVISYYKPFTRYSDKKYFIRNYIIFIKNSKEGLIDLKIETQYQFINDLDKEFKFKKCKELSFFARFNSKEVIAIINFVFSGNNKSLHSK